MEYKLILKELEENYGWTDTKEFTKMQKELVMDVAKIISSQFEPPVSQKTADEFRKLAENTYVELASELIRLAGEDKEKAKKTMEFMKARGFDNEDMQIIPILEKALWKAYNSRFSL